MLSLSLCLHSHRVQEHYRHRTNVNPPLEHYPRCSWAFFKFQEVEQKHFKKQIVLDLKCSLVEPIFVSAAASRGYILRRLNILYYFCEWE
ncbi:hypothetical protein ACSBR2_032525 [Camellia fascicularis]